MVESLEPANQPEEAQPPEATDAQKPADSQMQEWKTCEDGSDEHMIFCSAMQTFESICETNFELYQVIGYQIMANKPESIEGTIYEVKIKVKNIEGDNTIHARVWVKQEGEEP